MNQPAIAPPPCASLGDIDGDGRIWTTCGWSLFGPAWALERQVAPTVGYGWVRTGRTSSFMGETIVELIRFAGSDSQSEPRA